MALLLVGYMVLAHILAIRSKHDTFRGTTKSLNVDDAKLECSCGYIKTAEHIVYCRCHILQMAAKTNGSSKYHKKQYNLFR